MVDELTMDRVNELLDYWHKSPPAHMLLKLMVGYEPPKDAERYSTEAEVRELVGFFEQLRAQGRS